MITSVDAQRAADETQRFLTLTITRLNKRGTGGSISSPINGSYIKPSANTTLLPERMGDPSFGRVNHPTWNILQGGYSGKLQSFSDGGMVLERWHFAKRNVRLSTVTRDWAQAFLSAKAGSSLRSRDWAVWTRPTQMMVSRRYPRLEPHGKTALGAYVFLRDVRCVLMTLL